MNNVITLEDIEKSMEDIESIPTRKVKQPCGCWIEYQGMQAKIMKTCKKHLKALNDFVSIGQKAFDKGEEVKIYGISVVKSNLEEI